MPAYFAMGKIQYIDETPLEGKKILLRDDLNVSLTPDSHIGDDARIRQSLPTIQYLLERHNKLIIMSHLGRPKAREPEFSLRPVAEKLQEYLPGIKVRIIHDFLTATPEELVHKDNEILLLENIRYYHEEKKNDPAFVQKLAALGEVFVNDAFGVCHRADASVVGLAGVLPSYGGLLLKKEITMISRILQNPDKPIVAILGGAKVSTKINLIGKLMDIADHLIVGGGLANTFLEAQGVQIGKSLAEHEMLDTARELLTRAKEHNTEIILPLDAEVQEAAKPEGMSTTKLMKEITPDDKILDIGPETQAHYGAFIAKAKTIVWNGPVGYFEDPSFRNGTDFIYYAITENTEAVSIVGGGDTLAAISKKEYLEKITHISTGGGAMLEFIEKGSLPGIDALATAG